MDVFWYILVVIYTSQKAQKNRRQRKVLTVAVVAATVTAGAIPVYAAGLRDVFNAKYYADMYPDLQAAFGYNENALYQHFLTYGIQEGRTMSPVLDIVKYREAYGDLNAAFGDNWDAYVEHYFTYGIGEKRVSGGIFDPVAYAEAYPDIQAAFGDDYSAIIEHYLTYGISEGRTAGVTLTTEAVSAPAAAAPSPSESETKPAASVTVAALSGDVYGKQASALCEGLSFTVSGQQIQVTGTLKYVENYTGFNDSNAAEQKGYYLPFVVNNYSTDVTFHGSGAPVAQDSKGCVVFLGQTAAAAKAKTVTVTVNGTDYTMDITNLSLQKGDYITVKTGTIADFGSKSVSDLFGSDVKIRWEDNVGYVTGTFQNVSVEWSQLPDKDLGKTGHFFAFDFKNQSTYQEKPFAFSRGVSSASSVSSVEAAGTDEMSWVLRIDDNKVFKFEFGEGKQESFTLNFTGATLQ